MAFGLDDEWVHAVFPVVRAVVCSPCIQDAIVLLDDPFVPFAPV